MEGLSRVLYVGGFAKTITPALRCGYVVAERDVLRELARTKMAVGLTSSEATERIVEKVLTEGRYARHVEFVVREAEGRACARRGADGCARARAVPSAARGAVRVGRVADRAGSRRAKSRRARLQHGIWLAPGSYFRPDDAASACFRFNVPYSVDDALWTFLERTIKGF